MIRLESKSQQHRCSKSLHVEPPQPVPLEPQVVLGFVAADTGGAPSVLPFRYNGEVGDIVVGRITEVSGCRLGFYGMGILCALT